MNKIIDSFLKDVLKKDIFNALDFYTGEKTDRLVKKEFASRKRHTKRLLHSVSWGMARLMKKKINSRQSAGIHHRSLPFVSSARNSPPNKQFGFLSKAIKYGKQKGDNSFSVFIDPNATTQPGVTRRGKKSYGRKNVSEYAGFLEYNHKRQFFFPSIKEYLSSDEYLKNVNEFYIGYLEDIEKHFGIK